MQNNKNRKKESKKKPKINKCVYSLNTSVLCLHFSFFSTQFINNACSAMYSTVFILEFWSSYIHTALSLFCNNKSDRIRLNINYIYIYYVCMWDEFIQRTIENRKHIYNKMLSMRTISVASHRTVCLCGVRASIFRIPYLF